MTRSQLMSPPYRFPAGAAPAKEGADPPELYVATTLAYLVVDRPDPGGGDLTIGGTHYRRLDPAYHAWLWYRMKALKRLVDQGEVTEEAFQEIRALFLEVHRIALDRFGGDRLRGAREGFDPRAYDPPGMTDSIEVPDPKDPAPSTAPFLFPKDGTYRFTHPVDTRAVEKVDAIREEALAKGWTEERLYRNRCNLAFPVGGEYGLVCFVDEDRRLGKVTKNTIEIIGIKNKRTIIHYNCTPHHRR